MIGKGISHVLTEAKIRKYYEDFAQVARNTVEAGFDGVESMARMVSRGSIH